MEPTFIDWIVVKQNHHRTDLPIVGGDLRLKAKNIIELTRPAPGDLEGEILEGIKIARGDLTGYALPSTRLEGSHSTAVMARCDGSTVSVSGNVGRLDRPDNVFNYGIDDTIAKLNAVLHDREGLPPFTSGERVARNSVTDRDLGLGLTWEWTGAVLNELHATRNYCTGSEALAIEAMRHLGSQRAARISKTRWATETIRFGNLASKNKPLHKALVIYRKAEEMLAHAKGEAAKARIKSSQEYQYARDTGLVRIECKWGPHFLRDNGCRFLGDATMAKIISLFEAQTHFLFAATPDHEARLVAQLDPKLRSAALHWIRGDDLRTLYSRATFYRITKRLRDELGIDATEPRHVDGRPNCEDALQRHLDALPRITLAPQTAPEWYGLPEVERRAA
ncbi:MAG: hypothetical protein AB7E32_10705 [Desulfovibrio sp.]